MKMLWKAWQDQLCLLLFFGIIATSLMGPIATTDIMPDLADYANHLNGIIQAKFALLEGQFPLRVTPLEQHGWQYPFYQFYSSTTYTIAGMIYWLITPNNPLLAAKFTIWLSLFAASYYMYQLALWFIQSRPAALLASVVYVASPYYIIVVNRLGNLSEALALAMVPAVVYYTLQRFCHPDRPKTLLQTALVWYLLMTTHFITFLYTSLLVAIWLLLLTLYRYQPASHLLRTAIAYCFACVLGAWYLIPVGELANYLLLSDTYTTTASLTYFHPMLSYLLSPASLTSSEFRNVLLKIHPAVGWPILLGAGICVYSLWKKHFSSSLRGNQLLPSLLMVFTLAFFMAWSPFNFWQWLPHTLFVGQYSWRLLSQVIWIGAILFAWAVLVLFNNKLELKHLILGFFLIYLAAAPWIPEVRYSSIDPIAFKEHPRFVYNHNAYSIDFIKHPNFVTQIDSMLIEPMHTLDVNKTYPLHQEVLQLARTPVISVEGEIGANTPAQEEIFAQWNGKVIATLPLTPGAMQWQFSLPTTSLPNNHKPLALQFVVKNRQTGTAITTTDSLTIDRILLGGFLNPATTFSVQQTEAHCHREKTITLCQLNIPTQVNLVELPILYYPQLIHITVNGKPAHAQGIMYQGYLIAGITPEAGKPNFITMEFRGLPWANNVSLYGWGIWLILCIILMIRSRFASP